MTVELAVANADVVLPDRVIHGWVGISGGRIAEISTESPPDGVPVIDAAGLTVLPGRIEPHCHLRAAAFADDLENTARQAVAGGVTTLMPYMRATVSYLDLLPIWTATVENRSLCDVSFHLQIQTRDHLREIGQYFRDYGIQSIKVHIDYRRPTGPLDIAPVDDGDVFLAMQAVREFGGIVAVHCENTEISRYLIADIQAAGRSGLQAWADARPPLTEASDANSVVFLAKMLGSRVLIVHVSALETLEAVAAHHYRGSHIEVLVHQLVMSLDEVEKRFGSLAKLNPPLRDRSTAEGLWAAVGDGTIDFVGTDHSAFSNVSTEDSLSPKPFWDEHRHVSPGVGIALPMFLTEGLHRGIPLHRLSRLMSGRIAEVFGLDQRKGSIVVGADADLVLVDLNAEMPVRAGMEQAAGLTIAEGRSLRGWPRLTLVRGLCVYVGDRAIVPAGMAINPSAGGQVIQQSRN